MRELSADICGLFGAARITLYAVAEELGAIVARVNTGLAGSRALRLPVDSHSVAGYVAMSRQHLKLADGYDRAALRRIHPSCGSWTRWIGARAIARAR